MLTLWKNLGKMNDILLIDYGYNNEMYASSKTQYIVKCSLCQELFLK